MARYSLTQPRYICGRYYHGSLEHPVEVEIPDHIKVSKNDVHLKPLAPGKQPEGKKLGKHFVSNPNPGGVDRAADRFSKPVAPEGQPPAPEPDPEGKKGRKADQAV